MKKLKFWLNMAIGVAVAVFFLWLFFRKVEDWGEIWEALATIRYIYIVPAVLLSLMQFVFRTFRWYYLLHDLKRIRFFRLFSPMLIGFMGNCLLPARAGEFIRAYLISEKENIKLTASIASLVVDRMFDMFVLLLIIAGVLLFYPLDQTVLQQVTESFLTKIRLVPGLGEPVFQRATGYSLSQVRLFLGVFVSVMFMTLVGFTAFLYFKKELAAKIMEKALFFLPRRLREKIIGLFMGFTEGLHIFKNGRHVIISILLTFAQWFFGAIMFLPLYYAFDIQDQLPLTSIIAMLASAAVGVSIPAPGYAGWFHLCLQVGLQLCNASIGNSIATVFALVAHAVIFFPVILIGIALAIREGVSLTQIEATSERLKKKTD